MTDIDATAKAMLKSAEALETNNDQRTVGVNNVYPDAHKEPRPVGPQIVHGHIAEVEASNVRPKMLERLFDSMREAKPVDRALIAQNFGVSDYESHNPTLQKDAAVHGGETLSQLVQRTCGRR